VDEVLRQIRLLASNLRPPELEMLELNNVLENYCKDFSSRTRIPVEYLGTTTKALGKITETCLYRFLQEALTNVARHASAKRVRVRLGSNDDTISLLIEDDGRGFILETQATMGIPPLHLGLSNMRERLSLLGGWLEVHSKPGQGTRLLAHIPREEIQ
jgi:signal transduction histidine kinase